MKINLQDKDAFDYLREQQESEPILCIHCGKKIENWYEDDAVFTRLGDTAHKICDDRHEEGRNHG